MCTLNQKVGSVKLQTAWVECDAQQWFGGERKMGGSCDDRSTPLRIVLGTFSDGLTSQSSNKTDGVVELSAPIADGASVESPTTYILGTSYFATPSLGSSNSNSSSSNRRLVLKLNKDGRVPMEDRKGSFSQFKPKSLLLSVSYLFFCVCSLSLWIWLWNGSYTLSVVLLIICTSLA